MNNENTQANETGPPHALMTTSSTQLNNDSTTVPLASSYQLSEVPSAVNPANACEQMPAEQTYKMEPTNTVHIQRIYDSSDLTGYLEAPVSLHTFDAQHSIEEVAEIATSFRCAMKWAFEEGLRSKFLELGGECRVYFKKIVDNSMGMHAFLKDIEVAYFPEWCIGHIEDDDGYIRTKNKGWPLIDQYGDSGQTKGGIANAREAFTASLRSIADIIFDTNQKLCKEYESWLQAKFGILNPDEILTTDQMYLAFVNLMKKIPEIIFHIKNLTK